jgi:hypothetical protein
MSNNLPAVNPSDLSKALTSAQTRLSNATGDNPFLRLIKSGEWVYSADDIEVQEGSLWAVNSASLSEGYAAWGKGGAGLLGEEMAPMTGTPIVITDLPDVGAQWKKQVGFLLYCLNGDDKGTQVLYKTTSVGGSKAAGKLIQLIVEQIEKDPGNIMPVVSLDMDSYKHKEYGKIYTPIFEVKDWMPLDAVAEDTPEPVAEDTPEEDTPEEDTPEEDAPEPVAEKPKSTKRRRAIAK